MADAPPKKVSGLRIIMMVGGLLALLPATLLFGLFGFIGVLFFILLAAIAS